MGNKSKEYKRSLSKESKSKRRLNRQERKKLKMLRLKVGGTGRTDIDIKSIRAAGKGLDDQDVPTKGRMGHDGEKIIHLDDPKISLCMIVKDEEAVIARCLESLKGHVDEMIIVDTGSSDKTVEICESYGAKVFHHPWEDSFSVARNQAMSHVTTEWIIQLDGDEEMDAESAPKIRDLIRSVHNSTTDLCYVVLENKKAGSNEIFSTINTGKIIRMGVGIHYKNRIHNKLMHENPDIRLTGLKIYHYGYHLEDEEKLKMKVERTTSMLLEQVKELPEDPETRYYLTIQYLRTEKWNECIECSKETVELFLKHEPQSQLLLLTYHAAATCYYHKKAAVGSNSKDEWLKEAERLSLEALKIYPDYLDSNSLLSSIYFATKQYKKCYDVSTKYLNIHAMLTKDPSKSLVIPMNTLKNEWMVNLHLAINFYEQADQANAVNFLKRSEDCLEPDKKYLPSFTMFQYMFKRGDATSLKNAEIIYKGGYRAE